MSGSSHVRSLACGRVSGECIDERSPHVYTSPISPSVSASSLERWKRVARSRSRYRLNAFVNLPVQRQLSIYFSFIRNAQRSLVTLSPLLFLQFEVQFKLPLFPFQTANKASREGTPQRICKLMKAHMWNYFTTNLKCMSGLTCLCSSVEIGV